MSPKVKLWLKGILAAAISGAGMGMTGWAINIPPKKLLILCGYATLTSVGAYLKQSPLPNGQ